MGESPETFAILRGWSLNWGTWTDAQRESYRLWAGMEEKNQEAAEFDVSSEYTDKSDISRMLEEHYDSDMYQTEVGDSLYGTPSEELEDRFRIANQDREGQEFDQLRDIPEDMPPDQVETEYNRLFDDEEAVFAVLETIPTSSVMNKVQRAYRDLYGRNLAADLKEELSSEEFATALQIINSKP